MLLTSTHSFDLKITSQNQTGVITLLTLPKNTDLYEGLTNTYHVGVKTQLESLMATYYLPNLGKAPTPQLLPTDSAAESQVKIADIQSRYPKIGLKLYINSGNGFKERAMPCLQNFGRETYLPLLVPYFTMGEVLLLSENDQLGVEIVDMGNNKLSPLGDFVIFHGSFQQTRTLVPKDVAVAQLTYAGPPYLPK